VVATDAPVDDPGLVKVARLASTALARRISPVHTPFDGDLTFALSTAEHGDRLEARRLLLLGLAAREALETAILRAVGGERS
jgi:D-aminopeptidase